MLEQAAQLSQVVPSGLVTLPLPRSYCVSSALSSLLWYLHNLLAAAAVSYQTIDYHPVKNRLDFSSGGENPEGVGVFTQAIHFLHKQFVKRD